MWDVSCFTMPGERWVCQDRLVEMPMPHGDWLVLVCDGHGEENNAVEMCTRELPKALANRTSANPLRIKDAFREVAEKTYRCLGGSTASVAVLSRRGAVSLALLGDSPILGELSDGRIFYIPTHSVKSDLAGVTHAISKGGHVDRGYVCHGSYGLQMTSAFGDWQLREVLSREPNVQQFGPGEVRWVAVMTDGVLDEQLDGFAESKREFVSMVQDGSRSTEIVTRFFQKKKDDATLALCRFT